MSPAAQTVSTKPGVIYKPNWWRSILPPVLCDSLPGCYRGTSSYRASAAVQKAKLQTACMHHVRVHFVGCHQDITIGHQVPEPTLIFCPVKTPVIQCKRLSCKLWHGPVESFRTSIQLLQFHLVNGKSVVTLFVFIPSYQRAQALAAQVLILQQ